MHFTINTSRDDHFTLALSGSQQLKHFLLLQGCVHEVLDGLSQHPMNRAGTKCLGEVCDLHRVKEWATTSLVGLDHKDGEVQGGGRDLLPPWGHGEPDIRGLVWGDRVGNWKMTQVAEKS